jgi:hypothetical protein
MADAGVQDLVSLDRDIARAQAALTRWRMSLALYPEGHTGEDPFDGVRHVATKSTWDALGQLPASGAEAQLAAASSRWVYAFVQARVGRVAELALARAAAAPRGQVAGKQPRLVPWRAAWREVVLAKSHGEAGLWLSAAADAAPHVAQARRERAARRVEIARRLGVAHPWAPLAAAPLGTLRAAAARLLDATEDVSRAVWKEAASGGGNAAAILHAAVARDAGDGWPARLGPRWLEETFDPGARGLPIELPELPAPVGAASFARALYAFGFAVRVASAPASMPFVLAREPAFAGAHRLAFVFGALAADPEFHVRALGLGRHVASVQARVLAKTALLEARLHAARLLLGDDAAFGSRHLFEEIGVRLFGSPLDPRFCGAWPAPREDEPARFVALIEARALREAMRQRFDVDWFRNPRAWADVRAMGAAAAHEPVDEGGLGSGADLLGRAFEGSLA